MKGLRQGDMTSNSQQFDIEIALQRYNCLDILLANVRIHLYLKIAPRFKCQVDLCDFLFLLNEQINTWFYL